MTIKWKTARLGDVCQLIKRGIAPKYTESEGIHVINQKCIRDHQINRELARRHDLSKKKVNPERLIKLGDVLVNSTGTGTLGRVAQVLDDFEEPVTVDTHVTIVRPLEELFHLPFFGYMMMFIEDQIIAGGEGASGQTELPRAKLENDFSVTYPESFSEQKRVVAILDEAFAGIGAAIANTEKNLANARELFESYLNSVFSQRESSWGTRRFGDVCDFVRGPFGGSLKKSSFVTSGYAVYEQQHAIKDQFSNVRYFVSSQKFQEMTRFELKPGDLIMSCSGTMGKVAVAPQSLRRGIINQALLKLTPSTAVDAKFLKMWMESNAFLQEISKHSKGVAIKNVASVKLLKEIEVPIPAKSIQREIVESLEDVCKRTRELTQNSEHRLTALKELKQSLMQKAFSGELTANVAEKEVGEPAYPSVEA